MLGFSADAAEIGSGIVMIEYLLQTVVCSTLFSSRNDKKEIQELHIEPFGGLLVVILGKQPPPWLCRMHAISGGASADSTRSDQSAESVQTQR